jgi:hypothetical protein
MNIHEFNRFRIEDIELIMGLAEEKPVVMAGETVCNSLAELVGKVSALCTEKYLPRFAQMANFLAHGITYDLIRNPKEFEERYSPDFGRFNVSQILPPRIEDGQAVFYVQEHSTGVPFEVRCQWPYKDGTFEAIQYRVLPQKKG